MTQCDYFENCAQKVPLAKKPFNFLLTFKCSAKHATLYFNPNGVNFKPAQAVWDPDNTTNTVRIVVVRAIVNQFQLSYGPIFTSVFKGTSNTLRTTFYVEVPRHTKNLLFNEFNIDLPSRGIETWQQKKKITDAICKSTMFIRDHKSCSKILFYSH